MIENDEKGKTDTKNMTTNFMAYFVLLLKKTLCPSLCLIRKSFQIIQIS
jgi:hypothetical protein